MSNSLVCLQNVSKNYFQGSSSLMILDNINLTINKSSTVALIGKSGSGKTSLLNIVGMLDEPTSGNIIINDIRIDNLSDNQKTKLRAKNIGFVFQFHHLLPDFTALDNVILSQTIQGVDGKLAQQRALEILDNLGLKNRILHYPAQLSGGEQQRVSIARALVNKPSLIIADEPTGNLDNNTAQEVFQIMLSLVKHYETSVLLATHDNSLAQQLDKQYKVVNSQLQEL